MRQAPLEAHRRRVRAGAIAPASFTLNPFWDSCHISLAVLVCGCFWSNFIYIFLVLLLSSLLVSSNDNSMPCGSSKLPCSWHLASQCRRLRSDVGRLREWTPVVLIVYCRFVVVWVDTRKRRWNLKQIHEHWRRGQTLVWFYLFELFRLLDLFRWGQTHVLHCGHVLVWMGTDAVTHTVPVPSICPLEPDVSSQGAETKHSLVTAKDFLPSTSSGGTLRANAKHFRPQASEAYRQRKIRGSIDYPFDWLTFEKSR